MKFVASKWNYQLTNETPYESDHWGIAMNFVGSKWNYQLTNETPYKSDHWGIAMKFARFDFKTDVWERQKGKLLMRPVILWDGDSLKAFHYSNCHGTST